jgi:hypothetical protein
VREAHAHTRRVQDTKGIANIIRILCQVPQANAKLIPTLVQTVIDAEQQLAIKVQNNIYLKS